MQIGLVGLPMVGKTTLFNLVTNAGVDTSKYLTGKTETNESTAKVPDRRIDFLSRMYNPKKTTYAQIEFSDVPGLVQGASQGKGVGNQFLDSIRHSDLLIHVVRAFDDPDVIHVEDTIDPVRDVETIYMELLLADMDLVEKRIERIQSAKKVKKEVLAELDVLKKLLEALENEVPLHQLELSEQEQEMLQNYKFFSEKPLIIAVNTDEQQFKNGDYPRKKDLEELAREKNTRLIEICGQAEMEIAELPSEDRELFMEDLNLEELGIDRLTRTAYDYLGLISFFTVGEDEVKAWTIKKETSARKAAGKIHSDLERGFIRAEAINSDDLEQNGTMAKARENGLVRLEGKEYIVKDGDILNIRFNV
ncbi:MAG: redox-regulated ATPase YchF [Clostridiales bacterium]|nr:redox-regulated ATPase YchF [Clostridiales bacterium]MCF8023061.1 redox-regulated ATPase YchF [Clostridiales bacterium]